MRLASAIATGPDAEAACRSIAAAVRPSLGGDADLVFAFATTRYGLGIERVPVLLQELLGARTLCGCSGAGVLANGTEIEGRHAIAVLAGRLPQVRAEVRELQNGDLPSADAPPSAWHRLFETDAKSIRAFVVLPEPFHCDVPALLAGLDYAWPRVPKIGGIASGSRHPEGNALFANRRTLRSGAVVLAIAGAAQLQTVVAQGCRPFGRAGRLTKVERGQILAIDGVPALEFLEQQLQTIGDCEQFEGELPLFLGIAAPFAAEPPRPSDYLMREVRGVDPNSRSVVIGDLPGTGRRALFHLRNRDSSAADLDQCLGRADPGTAAGALLFNCIARGASLYGKEGHDSERFRAAAGPIPLAGFFCGGEIGPVAGTTALHAYTASFGLFRPAPAESS